MNRASGGDGANGNPARRPVHARLRAETAATHAELEAQLDLLGADLTLDRYRRVLRAFYGYYAPLEEGLTAVQDRTVAPDLALRARASLLERDLVALGLSEEDLGAVPRCGELPPLEGTGHLAGCVYVLEGASLGGRVIAPAVHDRLGLTPDRGCAFFTGDGESTGARWQAVLQWLEELASGDASVEQMVAAARATFRTLTRWADRQGVSR